MTVREIRRQAAIWCALLWPVYTVLLAWMWHDTGPTGNAPNVWPLILIYGGWSWCGMCAVWMVRNWRSVWR